MANIENQQEGLKWQVGVWDRISSIYLREVDKRFETRSSHQPIGEMLLPLT